MEPSTSNGLSSRAAGVKKKKNKDEVRRFENVILYLHASLG